MCVCLMSVTIDRRADLNDKTSLPKVSSSKRDPKKEHVDDLVTLFSDVVEICGNRCDYTLIYVFPNTYRERNEIIVQDEQETTTEYLSIVPSF